MYNIALHPIVKMESQMEEDTKKRRKDQDHGLINVRSMSSVGNRQIKNIEQKQYSSNVALSLHDHWEQTVDSDSTQYYKLANTANGACHLALSVVTSSDSTFNVYVCNKKVPKSCALLKEFTTRSLYYIVQ